MTDPASGPQPRGLRVEVLGGDPLGHGDGPALAWWLPERAQAQTAYQVVTDDGYDSGRVDSLGQSSADVPVFDRSRRRTAARVRVWTDLGESAWSDPVVLDSGLLRAADWSADWIGVPEAVVAPKGERPAPWLRSTFDLDEVPEAVLHVTALGVYEAFLNGERVGDVELAPGFTQYAARVQMQSYDVTGLLRTGPNALAVLLADGWYRGQVGAPRAADQFGSRTALRLQLESRTAPELPLAVTSTQWRTSPSHVVAADLIGGQREDRRLVDPGMHGPGFDDSGWVPVERREVDVTIVRALTPPVRRVAELRPVSVQRRGDGSFLVDLGQNIAGWVRLANLGPAGSTLTLRHGEHLTPDGELTTAHLDVDLPIFPDPLPLGQVDTVVSAGVEGDVFEPRFATKGFRYVRVEGHPGPLDRDDVTGVVVHTDLRRTGWFACSDERVNRLHEAVVWSLRGNAIDVPTDCPQRERAPWTGDWQVFAPVAAYLFDVDAFTRKWLRDVMIDQLPDGKVLNMSPCAPAEGATGPIGFLHGSAGWGDVVVSAPWDLWQSYGDEVLLRETFESARAWVDFAARAASGGRHPAREAARPVPAPYERYLWDSGFHWGEWLEPDAEVDDFPAFLASDKAEVATAYLHRSSDQLAQIAELLDVDAGVAATYREIADGARAAWRAEFVLTDGSLRVQTQASHVRALAFGLVEDHLRPAVAQRLVDLVAEAGGHLTTGFLSTGLLLPTLAEAGHVATAYALLLQDTEPSWLTMIDRGATTVWERWNGVDADGAAHESLNHYSKGAVIAFLHRYVAGLRPMSPGYRTFRVQPLPGGGLSWARTSHDSPFGRIEVSWTVRGGQLHLEVTVPGGTTAEVLLPDGAVATVGAGQHAWDVAQPDPG